LRIPQKEKAKQKEENGRKKNGAVAEWEGRNDKETNKQNGKEEHKEQEKNKKNEKKHFPHDGRPSTMKGRKAGAARKLIFHFSKMNKQCAKAGGGGMGGRL